MNVLDKTLDFSWNITIDSIPTSLSSNSQWVEICGVPFFNVIESVKSFCDQDGHKWFTLLDEVPFHILKDYVDMEIKV